MNTVDDSKVSESLPQITGILRAPALDAVGRGLASLFDVDAIGVWSEHDQVSNTLFQREPNSPRELCWLKDADLSGRLRESLTAEPFRDDDGEWLITRVAELDPANARLVWAYRKIGRGRAEWAPVLWSLASRGICGRHTHWFGLQTSTRQTNERLELAAVMASRLTHDFGNYLTGILGFTELSTFELSSDCVAHRYMREVLQAARQGADWIHRIHSFSRRNTQQGWPADVSCAIEAEEVRLSARGTLPVHLDKEIPQGLPLVAMDARALQQLLSELIANAVEATTGVVTIRLAARTVELGEAERRELLGAAASGSYVELTVTDDGPGIPPENQNRLLRDIFFSTKPKHRGLGLLIVYGHLRRAGGGMGISFNSETNGICVQLYLPVMRIDFSAPVLPVIPEIFLVHSDLQTMGSLRRVLEISGCRVSGVTSSQAALGSFFSAKPCFGLVILELQSPEPGGVELARRILEREPGTRFLFLVDPMSIRDPTAGMLLKKHPSCSWPLPPEVFLQTVYKYLNNPGAVK